MCRRISWSQSFADPAREIRNRGRSEAVRLRRLKTAANQRDNHVASASQ